MTAQQPSQKDQALLTLLRERAAALLIEAKLDLGSAVVRIVPAGQREFFTLLRYDPDLNFNLLLDVTVIDWLDRRPERFEVVYTLLSYPGLFRLRVKIALSEAQPEIESLCNLWPAANFLEREAWDMFGVRFKGHPDLRRILMYDEFVGHPLRKDYPLQGKQPRVKLRSPEVHNTARDMQRPSLVQINPRPAAGRESA